MSVRDPNILEAHNEELQEEERRALQSWSWTVHGFFLLGVFLLSTVIAAQAILIIPPSIAPRPILQLQSTISSIFPFSLLPKVHSTLLTGEADDRVNVLVTGIGGAGHNGPYLTDTILLASYQPSTNTAALLSIPRDLLVPNGGGGQKINSIGTPEEVQSPGAGAPALAREVEKLFGISIPYYLRVDFSGFEQLVDRIGGVDIVVDRSFEDKHYPVLGKEESSNFQERYEIVSFVKGPQHFDGGTALKFARSRYGNNDEGSDFSRMRRQQKVIAALKEKLMQPSFFRPRSIAALASLVQNHITTNIGFTDVFRLQEILNGNPRILAESLDPATGILQETRGVDGAYLLIPKGNDYALLKTVAADLFSNGHVVSNLPRIHVEIYNGTPVNGLGAAVSERLQKEGLSVQNVSNAPAGVTSNTTVIYDLNGKYEKERRQIATLLGASVDTTIPSWFSHSEHDAFMPTVQATMKPDFIILLGNDATARLPIEQSVAR